MATDVLMPRLSDSMEEGTVLKWLVEKGGEVKRGEPLVEIETDKANMTYDADTDGTLVEVLAGEGDTLPIGEVIARIGAAGEAVDGAAASEGGAAGSDGGAASDGGDGAVQGVSASPEGTDAQAADEGERQAVATAESDRSDPAGAGGGAEGDGSGSAPIDEATSSEAGTADGGERIKASPVARRIAGQRGVDISHVHGSGPGGRIVKADVLAAAENGGARAGEAATAEPATDRGRAAEEVEAPQGAEQSAAAEPGPEADGAADEPGPEADRPGDEPERAAAEEPAAEQRQAAAERAAAPAPVPRGEGGPKGEVTAQELTRLQQTVSRRMAESKATAPDFSLDVEIDMGACVELRGRLKEVADPVPSFNDMVVKACAAALREYPRANGAYRDGRFELYSNVNVGIAVAAQDTLIVPTIFDAGRKSLGQIARDARTLVGKVRDGSITPPELSGGTFTVSNLGMYGIDRFSAVINPPQAAILTVGSLKRKPVVDDGGQIVARDMMAVTLVCDHRILYGADGAEFLARVRELLEHPVALAL